MNIAWIDALERPYVEDNTIYMPKDVIRPDGCYGDVRWYVISSTPIAIVRIVWEDDSKPGDVGWINKWMFFDNGQEITWEQVQDKIAVVRQTREQFRLRNSNCVVPWGNDIETLVALESS